MDGRVFSAKKRFALSPGHDGVVEPFGHTARSIAIKVKSHQGLSQWVRMLLM
jgi:hypothetical protein